MTQQLEETKQAVAPTKNPWRYLAAAVLVLFMAGSIYYVGFMSGNSFGHHSGYEEGFKAASKHSSVDVTATVWKVDDGVKFDGNSTIKFGDPLGISLSASDVVTLATKDATICKGDLAISASLTPQTHAASCGWPAIHVVLIPPL